MLNKILMAVVIVLLFVSIVPGLLLEHDHEIVETKIISLPTCETSGVKRQVCSCGLYVDSKINPLDHDFSQWTITKQATCTSPGVKTSSCSRCGKKTTDTISIAPHRFGPWQSYGDNNCLDCGLPYDTKEMVFQYENYGGQTIAVLTSIGYCKDSCIAIPSTWNGVPVGKIGDRVFKDSNITQILIPASVIVIDEYAFSDCQYLTSILFEENSQLQVIAEGAFQRCLTLKSFTMPQSVVDIGDYAFDGCGQLQEFVFEGESNLAEIGQRAFNGCKDLIKFTIPSTVKKIGIYCFGGCEKLKTVVFEDPTGWSTFSNGKRGYPDLSDTSQNALYLTSYNTYVSYTWTKE